MRFNKTCAAPGCWVSVALPQWDWGVGKVYERCPMHGDHVGKREWDSGKVSVSERAPIRERAIAALRIAHRNIWAGERYCDQRTDVQSVMRAAARACGLDKPYDICKREWIAALDLAIEGVN